MTMKLTSFFLLVLCMQVTAATYAQNKISLSYPRVSLKQLFKAVEKQTDYRFVYNNKVVAEDKLVSVNVKNASLDDLMQQVLNGSNLVYTLKEDDLVVIYNPKSGAPMDHALKGRVVDADGNPLPGATIKISNSTTGTVSDMNGNYTLNLPPNASAIEVTFTGFDKQIIPINNKGEINVTLLLNSRSLEEVTVTGYTNYSRAQSASAASVVAKENINQVPMSTLDQILQGRVPGMSVISSSGQPGTAANVVIRGIGSLGGNSTPLYIMDGIPIEGTYLQTINPEDIESATVLKDASAKAQYGSRGSNGVIVITTKKGVPGRISVDYHSQYGFSNLTESKSRMMNTDQRLQFEEEVGLETLNTTTNVAKYALGAGWTYSPKNPTYALQTPVVQRRYDAILDSIRHINTDWKKIFFQQTRFQEQQVSVSGGNNNVKFYNSLNYYNQSGIARRTGLERYALRSNVDFKSDKLSGGVNLAIGSSSSSFTEGEASSSSGTAISAVYYALPYEYPYAPDGTIVPTKVAGIYDQREGSLALERLLNSSNRTDQLKTILGFNLKYQILPGFSASTRAGVDYRNSTDQTYINPDSYYGSRSSSVTLGGKGAFGEATRRNFNMITTSGLNYAKQIGLHDFEASALYEYVYSNYNSFGFTGFGLDGRLPETPAAITNSATYLPSVSGSRTSNLLNSYIGLARYTYDGKYTFNGSYRVDGSSRVAPQNKWHGFYSIGANWNIKREDFLKDVSLISDLSLRASYGITASPFSGSDFTYLPTYSVSTSYGGASAIRPTTVGNADYDWEYVNEFNTGFDLALFKSRRLRIVVDVYNKITNNMFVNQALPATAGSPTPLNLSTGKMRNRGIEFDVRGDVIKTPNFTWTLGANAAYNQNVILSLGNNITFLADGDTRILQVGMPYGTYYAPKWAGVNVQTGLGQYYNKDGSITSTYNVNTQSVPLAASLYPKVTGGFTSGWYYKGFSADVLFSFETGVNRWNNEDLYNENARYATSNQSTRMLTDRWEKPGDVAILQRIDDPRNFTSKDIQDASFLRLRNVNLGYTIPGGVLNKVHVFRAVKVFVQAQNLLTITGWRGLDPENNDVYGKFEYPAARTYTVGLNVNF